MESNAPDTSRQVVGLTRKIFMPYTGSSSKELGFGSPVIQAQQPRPAMSSGFFISRVARGTDSFWWAVRGIRKGAPVPVSGLPTCMCLPPSFGSESGGFETRYTGV